MSSEKYNLAIDGVKMVEYPEELRQSVNKAAVLWQEFCRLSDEMKLQFNAADPQWSVGYELKDGSGIHGDRKENFDFSLRGIEALCVVLQKVDDKTATDFIQAIERLGQQAQPMIEAFSRGIEDEYGIAGFSDVAAKSSRNAFFRFLHYPSGQADGGVIAEPHVDHSGFTFHLYETTDGCERLTKSGEWVPLPVADGQAASFASMQTQLFTNGEIKALPHRVLANEVSAKLGRYAIVCFVALEDIPAYDRKTHGRLQEMEPGFNYTMPVEQFSKLFN